jgi:hypothetical protein
MAVSQSFERAGEDPTASFSTRTIGNIPIVGMPACAFLLPAGVPPAAVGGTSGCRDVDVNRSIADPHVHGVHTEAVQRAR